MYKGDEILLYIEVSNVFVPIGCLTSQSMEENSELIEVSSNSPNGFRNYKTNLQTFSVSFEGVVTDNVFSLNDIRGVKRNRELRRYKIATIDGVLSDVFNAYVSDISEAANIGEFWTFSGSLKGNGKPILSYVVAGDNWVYLNGDNVVDLNGNNLIFIE